MASDHFEPVYLETYRREPGLMDRIERGLAELASCRVCPRNCDVNRLEEETAVCHTGRFAWVSSYFAHFGEEDCLRGWNGSGTIFFSSCNLKCVFCFSPDTRIATLSGQRRIEDLFDDCDDVQPLAEGWVGWPRDLQVRIRDGAIARVSKVFRRPFSGSLLSVKPWSCPPLLLTPSHELFAAHREDLSRVKKLPAARLTKDHFLLVPKRVPGCSKVELDVAEILRAAPARMRKTRSRRVPERELVGALSGGGTSEEIGRVLGYHPAYVRTLRGRMARGKLGVAGTEPVDVRLEEERVRFKGEHRPGIPARIALDANMAWLLGMYCAEGHVTRSRDRPNSHRLVFSFAHHEHGLANRTRELLVRLLGLAPQTIKRRTTVTVECGKASAGVLFSQLCGHGAHNKRVPSQLLDATPDVLRAFLDGYLAGDGHATPTHLVGTTVSHALALGLFELGLHLGVLASVHESVPSNRTIIEGRSVSQAPLFHIKLKIDRLEGRADPSRERTKWKDADDHFLVPVHRIEEVAYDGPVYNLEVEHPDHSYLAPFIAVGNCQNHDISQAKQGVEASPHALAAMMLELQSRGCHNINFVTPEHVVPQVLEALPMAIEDGLRVPIVYNTSGYDSLESLALMDGLVDIYMPDLKFWDPKVTLRLVKAKDYPQAVRDAIREMHRQVGDLVIGPDGLARRGVLVRHLVMPNGLAGTRDAMRWLHDEISPDTYVNVMDQYRPDYRADRYEEIARRTLREEHLEAIEMAREVGLHRIDRRQPHERLLRKMTSF